MSVFNSTTIRFEPLATAWLMEIMEIEHEAYPEPWTVGMFHEEIRNERSFFYVMVDEKETVLGYGGFWLILDEAHITSVTVRAADRGKGYGRRLTGYLLERSMEAGARIATLEVRPSNEAALTLYKSLGFKTVGSRKGYYAKTGEDAIIMLKEL